MDIAEVKRNLNKPVRYSQLEGEYILTGCMIRKGEDGCFYQAELFDKRHGNSVLMARLSDITAMTGDSITAEMVREAKNHESV